MAKLNELGQVLRIAIEEDLDPVAGNQGELNVLNEGGAIGAGVSTRGHRAAQTADVGAAVKAPEGAAVLGDGVLGDGIGGEVGDAEGDGARNDSIDQFVDFFKSGDRFFVETCFFPAEDIGNFVGVESERTLPRQAKPFILGKRSEERRVGKEC